MMPRDNFCFGEIISLYLFGWRDVGENDDLAMVVAMIKKVHCTFTFIYNDSWDK